jgi:NAD(P)-dependent dehydrogenase (short-subunit alcohol dehydrogenase family)
MRLEQRVAIITGAGRNIGEAVAHALADEGARVAIVDAHEGRGQAVADAINARHPDSAMALVADVSSAADVERMVRQVVDRWGRLDILLNNAAITDHDTVLDLTEEEWDRVLNVTLKSVFLCSKYAAKAMIQGGRSGRIVNTASTSGHRGRKDATAYTAAKAGVLNLTRTLATQLAQYNIRVNSVTPSRIGSPVGMDEMPTGMRGFNLLGRVGMPNDMIGPVLFLVSDESDFVTGIDLPVDGGAMAPLV